MVKFGAKLTRSNWVALAALAVLPLVWGYNWVVVKEALRYSEPLAHGAVMGKRQRNLAAGETVNAVLPKGV